MAIRPYEETNAEVRLPLPWGKEMKVTAPFDRPVLAYPESQTRPA